MATTFVGAGALAGNITVATQAIDSHANTLVGDILIAQIVNKSVTANAVSPPDGTWEAVIATEVNDCTTAADDHQYSLFWKRATVAGAQSYTFTKATDDNLLFAGVISSWRGALTTSSPLDATAAVRTETAGAADNVTFPAYDPTNTAVHVIFMAYYGNDLTTFAAAMSADTNPDCTLRYDLESALGNDCGLACTSGDNDGSNVASRTWASGSTTDAGNTGVVFALVAQEDNTPGQTVIKNPLPTARLSRISALLSQPLGQPSTFRIVAEAPEFVLGQPVEQWIARISRLASIEAQPLGSRPTEAEVFPFNQLSWPNPLGPAYAITLRSVIFRPDLTGQDQLPDRWREFPNPRGAKGSISLLSWLETPLPLPFSSPFGPYNWPNPAGRPRSQHWLQGFRILEVQVEENPFRQTEWLNPVGPGYAISLRTWSDPTKINLIGQDQLPGNQFDWPVPKGASRRPLQHSWTSWISLALEAATRPHKQLNWPNPRGAIPSTSLKTWVDQTKINLIGQDRFFGLAGHPNFDQPNPRGPSRRPQDWTRGFRIVDQAALFPAEGSNYDWPNPRGPTYPVSLRTWSDQTRRQLIGQDRLPERQTEWPNPRAALRRPDQHSWTSWIDLALDAATRPNRQRDWPNPRGAKPVVTLGTWISQTKINLIGQDKFFGLAGYPHFDWPVPKGPSRRPQDWQRGFRLLDQEFEFPAEGTNYDWPNPLGPVYPVGLRTFIGPILTLGLPPFVPPRRATIVGPIRVQAARFNVPDDSRSNTPDDTRSNIQKTRRPRDRG